MVKTVKLENEKRIKLLYGFKGFTVTRIKKYTFNNVKYVELKVTN